MEFQFGTNWATYSRFVGDIFGSPLAAEGIFAFFLESGFLAILVFGWDKVSPKVHFLATILVSLGSMFSAIWILVANTWQQTPGEIGETFHIVGEGTMARAEILDFWKVVFNDSFLETLFHTLSGAWLAGAFLVMSVSAFYIIRGKHKEFAEKSIKIALILAIFSSLFQLVTGHISADGVAENQPPKLAAFEGHYETGPAPLYLFGWVDEENREVHGLEIPGMTSFLIDWDFNTPVQGLNDVPDDEHPPVQIVFQSYHIMIAIGMLLILISLLGLLYWARGTLFSKKWFLWVLVFAVLLPQIANQLGWIVAEVGRQPWIVWGLLKTSDALSKSVEAGQVLFSLILFGLIYLLLFTLFIFLLDRKIKGGPEAPVEVYSEEKTRFANE